MKNTPRFLFGLLSTVAFCALLPGLTSGQTVVPSSADPMKATERYRPEGLSHKQDDNVFTAPEQKAAEPGADETFIMGGIRIEGMTLYKQEEFAFLYKDMIGKSVTVSDVNDMTAKITNRYRTDGYGLAIAYVPAQSVNDNETLVIRVDEGRIGNVEFKGDQPPDSFYHATTRYIEKIKKLKPVKTESLERYLLLINDLPGNTARAVLRPSVKDPGATDLYIYYAHKSLDAVVATDNRGSAYLGPWQTSMSAATSGALGLDERITVRGIATSPYKELQYTDLQYEQPIGKEGTRLITTVSYANTEPGNSLKSLNVKSDSINVMVRALHPLLRSRLENLYVRTTFDARNSATDLSSANLTDDRVRSLRLGMSYDTVNDHGGVTIVDTEISHGFKGLGATNDGTGRSVTNGKHDYTKVTLDVSRTQALPYDFTLLVAGSGQYASSPLLSSEQYLLGGPAYGTAYDPGELTGDYGAAGKIELRYGQSLNDPLMDSYQLYSYYDIGSVWRKKPLNNLSSRDSLASFGVGVRTNFTKDVTGIFEVAFPLTHNPTTDPTNDARIFGGLSARY